MSPSSKKANSINPHDKIKGWWQTRNLHQVSLKSVKLISTWNSYQSEMHIMMKLVTKTVDCIMYMSYHAWEALNPINFSVMEKMFKMSHRMEIHCNKMELTYLIMTQFKKVSPKVDGNAAKKIDKSSDDPLPHGLQNLKKWRRQHTCSWNAKQYNAARSLFNYSDARKHEEILSGSQLTGITHFKQTICQEPTLMCF